jgi:CHAD domain-containing protein
MRRLGMELKRVKSGKMRKRIAVAAKQLAILPDTPAVEQKQRDAALRAIEMAFNQVIERKHAIAPGDGSSIHRMRVVFKKFRYMVESLPLPRGRATSTQLKAMNAFQGSMGDIQDAEVLLSNVQAFAHARGLEGEAALTPALEELSRRCADLIETFLRSVDTVFTFWKPVSKNRGVR